MNIRIMPHVTHHTTCRCVPYSHDLAPLDFAVFPYLKSQLRGRKFENLQELQQETLKMFRGQNSSWFTDVCDKWVERHRKCVDHMGEYFEKETLT